MKLKIIWKEIVKDISLGMTDSELSSKYNLGWDQLRFVFKQLAEARERRIRMLVCDLRSGMAPVELRRKYRLSLKSLESALKLLLEATVITWDEFKTFRSAAGHRGAEQDLRQTLRKHPIPLVTVYEDGKPGTRFVVRDISEKGIGIVGIRAQIDEIKSLAVVGDELGLIAPFEFKAQCRWTKRLGPNGDICSGFSVLSISEQDLFRLREFMDGFTLELARPESTVVAD